MPSQDRGGRYTRDALGAYLTECAEEFVTLRGFAVPCWFDAHLSHPDWPTEHATSTVMGVRVRVAVDDDAGPVLAGIGSERGSTMPYGDAVALLSATVDLDTLLRILTTKAVGAWAARKFSRTFVGDGPDDTFPRDLGSGVMNRPTEVRRSTETGSWPHARRRRLVTSALLKEVVKVYRTAHSAGNPPTVAVSEHFGTSHRNATRWVSEARKAGIIGPALGPTAGEVESDERHIRRVITPSLLREVAEVYRGALRKGHPPTKAVAEAFTTTHTTAARWVREARKVGVLGPSQGTKPGEASTPSE